LFIDTDILVFFEIVGVFKLSNRVSELDRFRGL